jgi:hypothetical protein
MDRLPQPLLSPGAEVVVNGLPWRQVRTSPRTEARAKKVLTGRIKPHSPPSKKMTAMT